MDRGCQLVLTTRAMADTGARKFDAYRQTMCKYFLNDHATVVTFEDSVNGCVMDIRHARHMLTLFKSSQQFDILSHECIVLVRLNGRPGHRDLRTSSTFARSNHQFPASAECVVLPMDECCVSHHF